MTRPAAVIMSLAVLVGATARCSAQKDLSSPEVAVEAARDSFESSWNQPWYDSSTDGFKPIDLPPPRKPSKFWDWLENMFSGWSWDLSDVLTFLGWMIVAGLLTWIVIALIRAYQQSELQAAVHATEQHDARQHVARIEALPIAIDEPVGDFLQAARRAYDAGDLTLAIVYLFSFELLELDRSALVRLVKGKTNRHYLRELDRNRTKREEPAPQRVTEILRRTIGLFEAAFFGAHPPSEDAFDRCWNEASELQQLLGPAEGGVR